MTPTITTGKGQANYAFDHERPPMFIIDSDPAVRRAYDTWQAENEEGARLSLIERSANRTFVGLGHWVGPEDDPDPAHHRFEPYEDVSPVDFAAARHAHREAERAKVRQEERAARALKAFDRAAREAGNPAAVAASIALVEHEKAVAAFAALKDALSRRDEAANYAGLPAWHVRGAIADHLGEMMRAERTLSTRLERFPIDLATEAAR